MTASITPSRSSSAPSRGFSVQSSTSAWTASWRGRRPSGPISTSPPGAYLLVTGAFSATLVVVSVWIVRAFAPEAAGSGVQEIEGAMEGKRVVRWRRVLPVKFFGGFLSLSSGLVIGREGPTIHIGASIAQVLAEAVRLSDRERCGLLAAGGAAGLAAAFGAPLASILFVIEETRRQFPYTLRTYTALMLASVTSGIVTEVIAGRRPFMAMVAPETPVAWLPAFVVLGVALGALGVAFNKGIVWSLDATLALGKRAPFRVYRYDTQTHKM